MMKADKYKLTLDQPAEYQITVPGHIDVQWSDWGQDMMATQENDQTGQPITIFIGKLDQAALQGLLRRLYSLGVPLISVICQDCL